MDDSAGATRDDATAVIGAGDTHNRPLSRVSRRRVLIWFGAGVAGVTGLGLAATRWVRSPQQALAETAPPAPGVLTAPVEFRVLRDTVVLRGRVGAETSIEVTPVPAQGQAVVTGVRLRAGDEVALGAVVVEVAGRPLLALAGQVPAYRDLRPGMTGKDVAQLQQSLRDLGHDPGGTSGTFGPGTKRALEDFYLASGYEVPTAGDERALIDANRRVTQAERAVEAAQETVDRLRENPPTVEPGQPDPVAEAERQLQYAREDLEAAKADRAEVERTTGPMLPLSEYVFLPQFPARVEQMTARVGAPVEPPLVTLSSGALVVRARLNPGQRDLVAEGMAVEILSELHNISAAGVVASVGDLGQDETGVRSHPMLVTPTEAALDERLAGADVRLTVQAAATEGEVLVVPLSAVYADADGATAVLKLLDDGTQQRVVVVAGVSGDGYVAVSPAEDGALVAGDQVVVGAGISS